MPLPWLIAGGVLLFIAISLRALTARTIPPSHRPLRVIQVALCPQCDALVPNRKARRCSRCSAKSEEPWPTRPKVVLPETLARLQPRPRSRPLSTAMLGAPAARSALIATAVFAGLALLTPMRHQPPLLLGNAALVFAVAYLAALALRRPRVLRELLRFQLSAQRREERERDGAPSHERGAEQPRLAKPATEDDEDPYALLDVDPDASLEELRRAWRAKLSLYHPDRVATLPEEFQSLAEEKSRRLNEAYAKLCREREQQGQES